MIPGVSSPSWSSWCCFIPRRCAVASSSASLRRTTPIMIPQHISSHHPCRRTGTLLTRMRWRNVSRPCVTAREDDDDDTMMSTTAMVTNARHFHCTFHEPITPELITVESIEQHMYTSAAESEDSDGATQVLRSKSMLHETLTMDVDDEDRMDKRRPSTSQSFSASSSQLYTDVTSVDLYAKGKINNFLRRMGAASANAFEVNQESSSSGGADKGVAAVSVFRCQVKLKLPSPHDGMYVAEGIAENSKDAEHLAAMHAQSILDTLAIPLFALSSMQIKHVETMKRQGRFAPMPGDTIKPVGTIVPGPFRMLSMNAAAAGVGDQPTVSGSDGGAGVASSSNKSTGLFRGVLEAEVVTSPGGALDDVEASSSGGYGHDVATASHSSIPSPHTTSLSDDARTKSETTIPEASDAGSYASTCYIPWVHLGAFGAAPSSSTTAATTTNQPLFDPTENGMFQMVNVTSQRMSPSPDAILMPFVYDKLALERMKDYFLAFGVDIKKQTKVSHVAVAGYSVRMYVAEMSLVNGVTVIARGKAQDRDVATHLAAMHAELLLDALGQKLFPKDAARQSHHAQAVIGFGRWAPDPSVAGGDAIPPALMHAPLPLPLKQQVGGDEVWLDPQAARRQRSIGERFVMAHSDLNAAVNEFVEVNPPQDMLDEAKMWIVEWQRKIAGHRWYDAPLIVKMGDFYRASIVLPMPSGRHIGVRGGTAIGRSVQQAVDLASLHAVETLSAMSGLEESEGGIPLAGSARGDDERLVAFESRREASGLLTRLSARKLLRSVTRLGAKPPTERPSSSTKPQQQMLPYLPGYIIEGAQPRPMPSIEDLVKALSLDTTRDFELVSPHPRGGGGVTTAPPAAAAAVATDTPTPMRDEDIITFGNDVRMNLQMYFQRVAKIPLRPDVFISGYSQKQSVYNVAFQRVPLPDSVRHGFDFKAGGGSIDKDETASPAVPSPLPSYLLAIGLSLKKKDAERMCFIHAAQLLFAVGVDVRLEKDVAALERKASKPSSSSSSSQQQQQLQQASTKKRTLKPAVTDDVMGGSSQSMQAPLTRGQEPPHAAADHSISSTVSTTTLTILHEVDLPKPVVHPAFIKQIQLNVAAAASAPPKRR